MDSDEIKVNETHICVLRKKDNNNELFVDFIELKLKNNQSNQLLELKDMSENENRSVLELIDYVENSTLNDLTKAFNFCASLKGAFQSCTLVQKISHSEYHKLLEEKELEIKAAECQKKKEEAKKKKQDFKNLYRKSFYLQMENHVTPYLLERKYAELVEDKSILAFSHRRTGWSKPEFHLSDDLSVVYKTNFGYGSSSYFYTNIKYKGIDILPYSDWVIYQHANKKEIIRYTRRHLLDNNQWIETMKFTAEMYNSSVQEPERFVVNWIINEVDEMVKGLERMLNENENYQIFKSYFHKSEPIYLMGRDAIRFKGERISGALTFLDKLKELHSIYDGIELYIERIMKCNMYIYPKLVLEIKQMNKELDDLNKRLSDILPIWEKYNNKEKEYDIIRKEIYESVKTDPQYSNNYLVRPVYLATGTIKCIDNWQVETEKRLIEQKPEYVTFKKEYVEVREKYDTLIAEIGILSSLIREFEGYQNTISKHFSYANRSSDLTA